MSRESVESCVSRIGKSGCMRDQPIQPSLGVGKKFGKNHAKRINPVRLVECDKSVAQLFLACSLRIMESGVWKK